MSHIQIDKLVFNFHTITYYHTSHVIQIMYNSKKYNTKLNNSNLKHFINLILKCAHTDYIAFALL